MDEATGAAGSGSVDGPGDQGGRLFNICAGAALGALVGLLIGLSSSPVVASAAAAILALLVTFFGFGGTIGALRASVSAARILGFGIAMAVALTAGISLRAHEALGPSFKERVAAFSARQVDPGLARDLAIYQQLGLRVGSLAKVEAPAAPPATSAFAFGNESGDADPACATLDARFLPDPGERLRAMTQSPEPWASMGRLGLALPVAQRAAVADAAFRTRCGPAT